MDDLARRTPGVEEIRSIMELVDSLDRLRIHLSGTASNPGLLTLTEALVEGSRTQTQRIEEVIERLGAASKLSEQLERLPGRLLKPDNETAFRAAVGECLSRALADQFGQIQSLISEARSQATEAGVEQVITAISLGMDRLLSLDGDAGSKLFYRDKTNQRLIKVQEDELKELRAWKQRASELFNAKLMAEAAAAKSKIAEARRWSWKAAAISLVIGATLGLAYLAPSAAEIITQNLSTPIAYQR